MSNNASVARLLPQNAQSDAEKLGAEIAELCSYIYAAEAKLLALIRKFDEEKYWEGLGLCSCAHWLNLHCGIGMNAAREKVRVAHALAALSKIASGFERGELSYSKVRAMTRIANEANEDYLMMVAQHGTAHHVEKLVAKFRTASRLQDNEIANEQYRDRELSHYYDHDGCLVIKARLPAEQGALIVKALEMAMDRDFAEIAFNPEDKLTEGRVPSAQEPTPIATRRADAMTQIAETYMNNDESSGSTADRYQVVVHVYPAGTQAAGTVPSGQMHDAHHIEDGPGVTAVTSRRIACDCSVVGIKEDDTGEPLSIGRRSRSIPPPMRRALRNRDGGCRFPGCTNTRFVDGHHVIHWADGGETSLDNLILLCRHHHHLVHEGGFTCEKSGDGEVYFSDPQERQLIREVVLPGGVNDSELRNWFDREFFEAEIDSETCNTRWQAGEKMDWQMAVSALF